MKYTTPHQSRQSDIKSIFLIIGAIALLVWLYGCRTPRTGCPNMADLRAHKYDSIYGWVYSHADGHCTVWDKKTSQLVCEFYEPVK